MIKKWNEPKGKEVKYFKKHPTVIGAITPIDTIKKGDKVTMYGRGEPQGIITHVDRKYKKGGSIWYTIKRKDGSTITARAWDFKKVMR